MHRRIFTNATALVLVLGASLVIPQAAEASDGVATEATQTYEFLPAEHVVRVTVDLTVKNTTPSLTEYYACDKWAYDYWLGWYLVPSTCSKTTDYYIENATLVVEGGAQNLKLSADSGTVSKKVASESYGFTFYELGFKRIFNGHIRKIHATYDLPSSAPRTIGGVRAGEAYGSFCVSGNGADGGRIRVVTPNAFTFNHSDSSGLKFTESSSGGKLTYDSGALSNPISTWACFTGVNLDGYDRLLVSAPDGRPVIVEGWPEDAAWTSAVAADVRTSLPRIEALVGRPIPGSGGLEIREAASTYLGDYSGFYSSSTNVALVGEDFSQPGLVAHELSHAWFNDTTFASTWLSEGYAGWVESQNGGPACDRLPSYPGAGKPDLEAWSYLGPRATQADRDIVDFQYDASCWLVASVSDRIGSDRMAAIFDTLWDGTSAYGATTVHGAIPVTWQAWLDAVDELGMVPAGELDLDAVQLQLVEVGVATDAATLAGRSGARAAYHELVNSAQGWTVPEAIRAPLTTWNFSAATTAIAAAQRAHSSAVEAQGVVPESDALGGPIRSQWQAAKTLADLQVVAQLAADEASAANAIATARERDAGADPIARIGLLGTDTEALFNQAVAALKEADPAHASETAKAIATALDGASTAGWLRVGGGIGLVGVAAIAVVFIRRRRRPLAAPVPEIELDPPPSTRSQTPPLADGPPAVLVQPVDRLATLVTDADMARAVLGSVGVSATSDAGIGFRDNNA